MYDFNKVNNRRGTGCIKWDNQMSFGVKNGLLPFWIADTDFASLPEILEAIKKRCEHPIIGYSDIEIPCLKAIQSWYKRRHGWEIPLRAMLPGSGVVTSIYFTLQAITNEGDKVLVFSPVYDPFFEVIKNSNRVIDDCYLKEENESYSIDFKNFEEHLKSGVKAIILCNPHNPIGRVWNYKEMQKIADLCAQYSVYLLSDEIHGDITLYGNKYITMGKFPQVYDKLIVYTAISKTFNMAGLVSSCMMIPNIKLKDKIEKSLSNAWIFGPNALAFHAIEAAYTYGDEWVDKQNQYISENATFVINFIKENLPKVKVTKPEGTFLMWLNFKCLGINSDNLTKLMAEKYGLALNNGNHYGKQADGFMRFNIGCSRAILKEGLNLLKKCYDDCNCTYKR
ncbi:pyridoxal phosphate-dependent aminotransferase [Fusobacterium simiae]|uniref:cysteine-S-conjugate beta-lyase n=1 Tax=Fusobacterium simiae TaxID=855 RepID=A0ABT4DJ57_FUSSI|nr:MalY/PatB family protein [Fusobacterium simiae]MCY7008638.1 pyridoxal phosphate-dependent aminotransferase [Fusobacterium simiae]